MLDHAQDASIDEEQLIHELHLSCIRLLPVLQHLAASDAQGANISMSLFLLFIIFKNYLNIYSI
jgi:hypothetical protein